MEDTKIIELYWQRDEVAINKTEEKYGNYMSKIAFNILMDVEETQECVNDAYYHTWKSIPPNRPEKLALYLGKITRNLAINKLREKNALMRKTDRFAISLTELEECIPSVNLLEEKMDEVLLAEIISKYLETVTNEARICFVRKYFNMNSIKEISELFNMSEAKIRSLLYRTRKGLKKFLEREGYEL